MEIASYGGGAQFWKALPIYSALSNTSDFQSKKREYLNSMREKKYASFLVASPDDLKINCLVVLHLFFINYRKCQNIALLENFARGIKSQLFSCFGKSPNCSLEKARVF